MVAGAELGIVIVTPDIVLAPFGGVHVITPFVPTEHAAHAESPVAMAAKAAIGHKASAKKVFLRTPAAGGNERVICATCFLFAISPISSPCCYALLIPPKTTSADIPGILIPYLPSFSRHSLTEKTDNLLKSMTVFSRQSISFA